MKQREEDLLESFLLCSIPGIGSASIRKLIDTAKSPAGVRRLSRKRVEELLGVKRAEYLEAGMREENRSRAARRLETFWKAGIFFLPLWDPDYPGRLRQIADPPVALYGKGKLPDREKKAVAIIGARECSVYGRETARYFASGLAAAGVEIISGMARGVDGIAQTAALDAGGNSIAVLGCGVDICYPPENRILYQRLEKEGCLLSEYPPGTQPSGRLFPPRNRVISGLADLVLVTEARERSGTLITVDMALEQGRDVFAVPGRITDRCSVGCNSLIINGAGTAVSVSRLLSELGVKKKNDIRTSEQKPISAGETQYDREKAKHGKNAPSLRPRLLAILDDTPKSLDEIIILMKEKDGNSPDVPQLMQELVLLCMEGIAGSRAGLYFTERILPQ